MNRPGFLHWLSTANSLIFFVFGLLGLGVLSYGAYRISQDVFRPRQVSNVAAISAPGQAQPTAQETLTLGNFETLSGTPYLRAGLTADQHSRAAYYDKTASSLKNYLFFNTQDRTSRWLVPGQQQLFLQTWSLGTPPAAQHETPKTVTAILYLVVNADTNGNGRLDEGDRKTLGLSQPSGANYTEVLASVDRILGVHPVSGDRALVFYATDATDQQNQAIEIDLTKSTASLPVALPPLQ